MYCNVTVVKCQCRTGSVWQVSHKGSKAGTDVPRATLVVNSRGATSMAYVSRAHSM